MLKLNKELNRLSGGTIPTNSIIVYKMSTEPFTQATTIVFDIYANIDALKTGKPAMPHVDIAELVKDGKAVNGGKYTPSDDILASLPENPKLVDVTDEIAKRFVEDGFFGANTITKIGSEIPE